MLAKKVAYNTFAQIFGKIVGFFISGITLVLIAEHLGTANMGNYVTIVAFVGFFVTISDLGANLVMVREIAQNEPDKERITGEFFGFRLTFSLLIMFLAPIVAMLIPAYAGLIVKGAIIATVTQFLLLLNQLFISMLQTRLMLDRGVLAELINRVVTLGAVIGAIRLGYQGVPFFYAVLYAALIGAVVNLLVTGAFATRLWPVRPKVNLESWKRTMLIIAPIGAFTFLGMVHFKADTIILSLIKSPHDVGVYGYAYKIGEILFTFPTMFMGAVFPRLSQLLVSDKAKFTRFAQTVFDAIFIGTIPFLTIVFMAARYLTLLLSRTSFQDGWLAGSSLEILTVAMAAWFIGTFFIHVLIMANDYKGLIRNLSIAVVINIILNLIFIPRYSYYGAAATTCITEIIMLVLTWSYSWRRLSFSPRLAYFGQTVFATAVMALVLSWLLRLPFTDYSVFAGDSRVNQMLLILGFGAVGAVIFLLVFYPLAGRRFLNSFRGESGGE